MGETQGTITVRVRWTETTTYEAEVELDLGEMDAKGYDGDPAHGADFGIYDYLESEGRDVLSEAPDKDQISLSDVIRAVTVLPEISSVEVEG